jgi:C-terminal, D2-small domain, of ClpB protein
VSSATNRPFLFRITEGARQFLLDEGTDERYGARHLKRAIERFLIRPSRACWQLDNCSLVTFSSLTGARSKNVWRSQNAWTTTFRTRVLP